MELDNDILSVIFRTLPLSSYDTGIKTVCLASMCSKRWLTQIWAVQTIHYASRMNAGSQNVEDKLKYMTNIEELALTYTDLTESIMGLMTKKLTRLELCNVSDLSLKAFESLLSKCGANLEWLRIAEQPSLQRKQGDEAGDSAYTLISKYCPNLRYLEVVQELGNEGLNHIAEKCEKLETALLPSDAEVSQLRLSMSLKRLSSRSSAVSKYIEHPFIIEGSMREAEWQHNHFGQSYDGQIPLREAIDHIVKISPQGVGINLLFQNWSDNETNLLFEALRVHALPRDALDLLVSHGASPHLITPNGHSAFYYVKTIEGLKFLLDCGVNILSPVYKSGPYSPNVLEYYFREKEWVMLKEILSDEVFPKIKDALAATNTNVLLLFLHHYEDNETHDAFLNWVLQPERQKKLGFSINDRTIFHTLSGGPFMSMVGSGASSLKRSDLGYNCLHIACQKGLPEKVLRVLLAAGADPFAVAPDGVSTPLVCALSFPRFDSKKNHSDAIQVMMELHVGHEDKMPPANAKHCPEAETDFFGGAWKLGRLDIIRTLIGRMKNVDKELGELLRGPQGYFSLACGNCLKDNGELALELLSKGLVDKDIINQAAKADYSPFDVAERSALWSARELPHLIPVLLQHGAEITPTISTNIGHYDIDSIKLLLATGRVNLQALDPMYGRNVFASAFSSETPDAVLQLLWDTLGEQVSAQQRSDMVKHMSSTPQSLIHIVIDDSEKMDAKVLLDGVTWLVEHGADIKATDQNRQTAAEALADRFRHSDVGKADLKHYQKLLKLLDPEGTVASPFSGGNSNRAGFVTAAQLDAYFQNAFAVPEGSKNVIL